MWQAQLSSGQCIEPSGSITCMKTLWPHLGQARGCDDLLLRDGSAGSNSIISSITHNLTMAHG